MFFLNGDLLTLEDWCKKLGMAEDEIVLWKLSTDMAYDAETLRRDKEWRKKTKAESEKNLNRKAGNTLANLAKVELTIREKSA